MLTTDSESVEPDDSGTQSVGKNYTDLKQVIFLSMSSCLLIVHSQYYCFCMLIINDIIYVWLYHDISLSPIPPLPAYHEIIEQSRSKAYDSDAAH